MTGKKLYRSRDNRMLAGICGGLGEFLSVDPTVVRVLAVISLVFGGAGFIIYVLLWFVIPEEPTASHGSTYTGPTDPPPPSH